MPTAADSPTPGIRWPATPAGRRRLHQGFGLAYLVAILSEMQLVSAGLIDHDGYFHAALAHLLPSRGLSREFRWTQVSLWRDHFCDKEFLFHLAMAPFTFLTAEPFEGARLFSSLLVIGLFVALFWVLKEQDVPAPLAFSALLGSMGGLFLIRLTAGRAQTLSILLLIVGLQFALARRWRALAVLAFFYAWSYSVPYVLFLTLCPVALGQGLKGVHAWRGPVLAFAGSTLGLVLHPYSPESLRSVAIHLDVVLHLRESGGALSEGFETHTLALVDLVAEQPLLVLGFPLSALLAWRIRQRATPEALGLLLASGTWLAAALYAPRFIEYACPLAVLSWGVMIRDALGGISISEWMDRRAASRILALATGGLAIACHLAGVATLLNASGAATPPLFAGAAAWMREHLAPEETVVNLVWSDFPDLFYSAPRQSYVWGLEPRLSLWADPRRTELLNDMIMGRARFDPGRIAEEFHARYAILAKESATGADLTPLAVYDDLSCWVIDLRRESAGLPPH